MSSVGQKISEMGLVTSLASEDLITAVDVSAVLNVRMTYASLVSQLTADLPSSGGDVTKVGTPANNEIGVWTGDGTIEGDSNFTWNGNSLGVNSVSAGSTLSSYTLSINDSSSSRISTLATNINSVASGEATTGLSSLINFGSDASREALNIEGKIHSSLDTGSVPVMTLTSYILTNALSNRPTLAGYNYTTKQWEVGADGNWNFQGNDIHNVNEFYIGDRDTNGSWRFIQNGDDLLIQQREAGTYNTKQTIAGA